MSGNQPTRSDTEKTLPPLTEDEFLQLEDFNKLASGHTTSSIEHLILSERSSVDISEWVEESGSQVEVKIPDSDYLSQEVVRFDSLDANPFMVDPREVSTITCVDQSEEEHDQLDEVGEELDQLKEDFDQVEEDQDDNYEQVDHGVENHFSTQIPFELAKSYRVSKLNQTLSNVPSPTSANPSTESWPGVLDFNVRFQKLAAKEKTKSWGYSQKLEKLFIDFNKLVPVCFHTTTNPPDNLYVRILPIFAVASSLKEPVRRCPNHAEPSDMSNQGFLLEHRWHLVRVNHDSCIYEEDPSSKRLSVVIPLERPQGGTNYTTCGMKFMCLGSDVGGINRKPIKLIFTLEHEVGNVIGRRTIDLRICSCPKRDKQQEEKRYCEEEAQLRSLASDLARVNSNLEFLSSDKKRKFQGTSEDFIMMPVARADFEKLNELAEAAVIVRCKDLRPQEIKSARRKLLEKHNPGMFTKNTKPSQQ